MNTKFDNIAPLEDHEVKATMQELVHDPGFKHAVTYMMPSVDWDAFTAQLTELETKKEFQAKVVYPVVTWLGKTVTTSIRSENWDKISKDKQHLLLSNHRDIVLDAGLLNILRHENGFDTTEIAIGDNLLIHPWIEKLVKLNKSFIVRRGLSIKEQLTSSMLLSEYITYNITQKGESVWIAQREGRAKDSDDKTQDSLIKMLTLNKAKDMSVIEYLKMLNIIPLSISYEYDPCDYLKAAEYQLKRDNPEYKKTQRDDLLSMEIGLLGQKGEVMFRFGNCINDELDQIIETDKRLQITAVAKIIDKSIHLNYEIFKVNYMASDLLNNTKNFTDKYTETDLADFNNYLTTQINKISIENIDYDFVREKMLIMYSNTLKNHLIATNK